MRRKFGVVRYLSVVLGLAVVLFVGLAGGYVAYVAGQYYRIEDKAKCEISGTAENTVNTGVEYKISTYNIGFGAYSPNFTFFMDSGVMNDGTKITGERSTAISQQDVLKNVNGATKLIEDYTPDFAFFQEVDVDGTRSYHVNQYDILKARFENYQTSFAVNFHSAYLLYPFGDPHGKNKAGIATFSRYKMEESVRRSFPVDNSFIEKFFDLDRCFMINYLPVAGTDKTLCLINLHLSAYDKGGLIRKAQMDLLNEVLSQEAAKGNYVIAGGDFNHDIADSMHLFPCRQQDPAWVYTLKQEDLAAGLRFAAATNAPTCRAAEIVYEKGVNFTVVIDGFIVSENVETVLLENIDAEFAYSDHNPATMTFKLK